MDLDDCRELARELSGKASISSLSLRQRWELIEELKVKGARVHNPPLPEPYKEALPKDNQPKAEDVYPSRLADWEKRFPRSRPGFASNRQLAWIEALWGLDFNDGRAGANGLRGFIYRQTRHLEEGPVSDLAFLRGQHVKAVITPLKAKAQENLREQDR